MGSTAAPVSSFLTKLKVREEVAEGTMSFHFAKPAGFVFTAGQSIDMTLIDPEETDAEGNTRAFTLSGPPYQDTLMLTTRLRDTAFKRVLKTMSLGTEVKIEGPFGDLRLHNNVQRAAVFLAGGVGITPFHSIVLDAAKRKLAHHIFLFYSNRRPEDAPFLHQLQALEKEAPNYKLVGTMTGMQNSNQPWQGEQGPINKAMLDKYLQGAPSPIYYIAGPPAMVAGLHKMLQEAGIDDDDVRTEEFSGY